MGEEDARASSPWRAAAGGAVLAAIVFSAIHAATPGFAGTDDYYHVGWSRVIGEAGPARFPPPFPWLPYTILNEDDFVDHHLLYHVLLSPWVQGDARRGGKAAAVAFAAAAMGAFAWLLARWAIPHPLLWTAALLAASHPFLYRMSMVRAQSASLAFLLVATAFAAEARPRALLYLGLLYVWLYDAFPLLLGIVGLAALAEALATGRIDPRPAAHAGAGIGLGLVLHPYFPLNVRFTYLHLVEKIAPSAPVAVGREWAPYDSDFLLTSSLLAFLLLGAALLVGLLREGRIRRRELFALLLAAAFFVLAARSRRFIEYFPPFAVLGAATILGPPLARRLADARRHLVAVAAAAVLVAFGAASVAEVRADLAARAPFDRYRGAARWLAESTPRGSVVVTSDWDDFPELFYFNRHNRYLIGLDPTYGSLYDPARYARWVEITRGDLDDADELVELWDAHAVFSDRRHRSFLRAMERLEGVRRTYMDRHTVVYRIER